MIFITFLNKWFKKKEAGKIRDIKIVRDTKTGKSKGLAFVEFFLAESVEKAIALSRQKLLNQQIIITHTQSDKNRGFFSAKFNNQKQTHVQGLLPR